jgi:cobyrinic acid a,c-diamide synthase
MTNYLCLAGTASGVGKTTLTMGLIAALTRRGLTVQPFKAGPDYIDPTYHSLAAGRPCRNIDTWMVPPDRMVTLFHQAARQADVAVIEGVMGLFDGASYIDEHGSTAEIAKLLGAPVLLILDVGKMARSAGALALGYARFDPGLKPAGFLLNRCGSVGHFEGVKSAIEAATGLPVLGWLPKAAGLHIPERHLGLVPTNERGVLTDFINQAGELVEGHFDLEAILRLAATQSPGKAVIEPPRPPQPTLPPVRIAVAHDAAFGFYYEDNFDLLRQAGADLVFFSPLQAETLPPAIDGLYLGGGFPELYAAQLAANHSLLATIRRAHLSGLPIYAECGGFMLLTAAIVDLADIRHPMVGLIPGQVRMQSRLVSLGYRLVEGTADNFLLSAGQTARGHEFHWSQWEPADPAEPAPAAFLVRPRRDAAPATPTGFRQGKLVASYIHLHFASQPDLAGNFVRACRHQFAACGVKA